MTLIVYLATAILCAGNQCYPVLVGRDTPIGRFAIHRRYVLADGYGGDVLQFLETRDEIYAIHRVWLKSPKQRRAERLAAGSAAERRLVTGGCINIAPEVYERIVTADTVEIRP